MVLALVSMPRLPKSVLDNGIDSQRNTTTSQHKRALTEAATRGGIVLSPSLASAQAGFKVRGFRGSMWFPASIVFRCSCRLREALPARIYINYFRKDIYSREDVVQFKQTGPGATATSYPLLESQSP